MQNGVTVLVVFVSGGSEFVKQTSYNSGKLLLVHTICLHTGREQNVLGIPFNPLKFIIFIFIHYKPRIAVAILDL